ncbi:MAG: hypothetical protein ABIP33_01585 [Pseudolysinimonas sp.]
MTNTPAGAAPSPKVSRGELVLAWIALGFAVIALPGVLIFLPWSDHVPALLLVLSSFSPLTAFVAWVLSLTATLMAGIRLIRRQGTRLSIIAIRVASPVAVLSTAALVVGVYFLASLLGLTQGNQAADLGRPLTADYTSHGARLICDNGDGGYGPDNRSPWYDAFLEAPASLGTEAQARKALKLSGFSDLRPSDDAPPAHGFALTSGTTDRSAGVVVFEKGGTSLYCSNGNVKYGTKYTPPAGSVLVHVSVYLPPRK